MVTGGASGLGLAVTRALLEKGAAVSVWDYAAPSDEVKARGLDPHP